MSDDRSTALARVDSARTGALMPFDAARELPAIFQLAKALSQARGFLPSRLKSEGEIVAVILAGSELGLPPMVALRSLNVIEGEVSLDADIQLALMIRGGVKIEWLKDGADGTAHLRLERAGHKPYDSVYSLEDAKKAGLAGKQNWSRHTKAMLRARCVSAAGRAYCPDILAGVYVPDELEDVRHEPARPTPATVSVMPVGPRATAPRTLDDIAAQAPSRQAIDVTVEPVGDDGVTVDVEALRAALGKAKTEEDLARWYAQHADEINALDDATKKDVRHEYGRALSAARKAAKAAAAKPAAPAAPETPPLEPEWLHEPGANDEPDPADLPGSAP